MRCLYPDCDYATDTHTEADKRQVIDHINQAHDEAHALIPCVHDMQELERFVAVAIDPQGVKHDQPQIRLQCVRCGQFEVRADDEPTIPGDVLAEIVADARETIDMQGDMNADG